MNWACFTIFSYFFIALILFMPSYLLSCNIVSSVYCSDYFYLYALLLHDTVFLSLLFFIVVISVYALCRFFFKVL